MVKNVIEKCKSGLFKELKTFETKLKIHETLFWNLTKLTQQMVVIMIYLLIEIIFRMVNFTLFDFFCF